MNGRHEERGQPTGIPQWLEQFLNSQGGMQGLLYQVGGMQGLLQLIQQQSQPGPPNPNPRGIISGQDPTGLSASDRRIADPYGWWDYRQAAEKARPNLPRDTTPRLTYLPDEEYAAWKKPGGNFGNVTGLDAHQFLPASLQGQGTPEEIRALQQTRNQARQAFIVNQSDPALQQAYSQAEQALNSAQYGPLYQTLRNNLHPLDSLFHPQSDLDRRPKPLEKGDYAKQYGYGQGKGIGQGANVQQTLRAAGWDPSKGFGPQTEWGKLSTGAERTPEQQKQLNDMLYAISPNSGPGPYGAGTEFPTFGAYHNSLANKLPESPDPFAGMQSAINRDAYVNDTLGGGFYGGLIPEEDARNTFGNRSPGGAQDPHFPTPQLRLNPMPGQDPYDTYAGWASDQGAAFGTAPWASDSRYGHAQGFDDPRRYQQPPAPGTAWQPTPQFGQGGVNTFAGTQGWGNTSRNGQQNAFGGTSSTQQQPMTFGASPWGNPWGMR